MTYSTFHELEKDLVTAISQQDFKILEERVLAWCLQQFQQQKTVKLFQAGEFVGTLPRPDLHPREAMSFLMEPAQQLGDPLASLRSTDMRTRWVVDASGWQQELVLDVDPTLGLGDLQNLRGFNQHGGIYDPVVIARAKEVS